MRRRSGRIRVDVDLDEILEEIDTADLKAELKARVEDGEAEAAIPAPGEFTEHDWSDIRYFVATGKAHDLLSLMAGCLGLNLRSPVQIAAEAKAKQAAQLAGEVQGRA